MTDRELIQALLDEIEALEKWHEDVANDACFDCSGCCCPTEGPRAATSTMIAAQCRVAELERVEIDALPEVHACS